VGGQEGNCGRDVDLHASMLPLLERTVLEESDARPGSPSRLSG
jgi:hypothetical protein